MREATAQHLQAIRGEWVGEGEAAPGDESCFGVKAGVTWEPTQTRVTPLPPTCPITRFQ